MGLHNLLLVCCISMFCHYQQYDAKKVEVSSSILSSNNLYQIRQDFIKRQRYQRTVTRRISNAQNAKHD